MVVEYSVSAGKFSRHTMPPVSYRGFFAACWLGQPSSLPVKARRPPLFVPQPVGAIGTVVTPRSVVYVVEYCRRHRRHGLWSSQHCLRSLSFRHRSRSLAAP
jgi:hypothetical protein